MKKYLSILALAALTACSNEDDFSFNPNEIRLSSSISSMTRASDGLHNDYIQNGRSVGVTIRSNTSSAYENIKYLAGDNGTLTTTNQAYWPIDDNEKVQIYAYHPHKGSEGGLDKTIYFQVDLDQSTNEAYLNSDILYASTETSKPIPENQGDPTPRIDLKFAHKMAKIVVQLVNPEDGSVNLNQAKVSICNTETHARFNPLHGDIYSNGTQSEIVAGTVDGEAGVMTVAAIIVPQRIPGQTKFIKIEAEGKTYYYTLPNQDSRISFESGYVYTYNLTIKEAVPVLLSSQIEDWKGRDQITSGGLVEFITNIKEEPVNGELTYSGPLSQNDMEVLHQMIRDGKLKNLNLSGATVEQDVTFSFQTLSNLESIVLPSTLERLEDHAFADIYSLKSVSITTDELNYVGPGVFANSPDLTTINLTGTSTLLQKDNDGVLYRMSDVYDEDSQGRISTKWTLWAPSTITSISTLPADLYGIGSYTFANNKGLTNISLPDGLKEIGNQAFYNCIELATITLPNSVKRIGNDAFAGCSKLTSLTMPDNLEYLNWGAFQNTGLTSVTLKNKLRNLEGTFVDMQSLEQITIDITALEMVDRYFIQNCPKLATIELTGTSANPWLEVDENNVLYVNEVVGFNGVSNVTQKWAVWSSPNVSGALELASNVYGVESRCFMGRTLTSVHIPGSVMEIRDNAFACHTLTDVYFEGSVPMGFDGDWAGNHNYTNTITIHVPAAHKDAYQQRFDEFGGQRFKIVVDEP